MERPTPKQLSDMSGGTFEELIEKTVQESPNVDSRIVRELLHRFRQDKAKLIQQEQYISNVIATELDDCVSQPLKDSIFMSCFNALLKEYDKPTTEVFVAVAEEALLTQKHIVETFRRSYDAKYPSIS